VKRVVGIYKWKNISRKRKRNTGYSILQINELPMMIVQPVSYYKEMTETSIVV